MTGNLNTFRQGATAYRNARDWAKKQRDEAIKGANKRANDSQVRKLTVDASFTTGASLDETDTIEALSQESQTSLNKDSYTTVDPSESEISMDELASDYRFSAKRLRRHLKRSHQPHQKRYDGSESGALK
jgi:hypothetical protein